jgi:hypothetical protein
MHFDAHVGAWRHHECLHDEAQVMCCHVSDVRHLLYEWDVSGARHAAKLFSFINRLFGDCGPMHAELPLVVPGAASRLLDQWKEAIAEVQQHSVYRAAHKAEALARIRSERQLKAFQKEFRNQLMGKNLTLLPEYGLKLSILKQLAFVSETEVALSFLPFLATSDDHENEA